VTLFPIEWEEPVGLVMIESMACGTPVIATRWGAVPEVIEEDCPGGIVVDDYRQMAGKIVEADEMDPYECRAYVEERFSRERMVSDYLRAYRTMIEQASTPAPAYGGQSR
jgi:glycosyltransferase involved in cell wall biosynthesis